MDNIDWVTRRLPKIEKILLRNEPDYYGASYLIAAQLGKADPPRNLVATWTHGCLHASPVPYVRQLVQCGGPEDSHLVATYAQVRILKQFGFANATAVGMPFIYADAVNVER